MSQYSVFSALAHSMNTATWWSGLSMKSPLARFSLVVWLQTFAGTKSLVVIPGLLSFQHMLAKPEQSVLQPQYDPVCEQGTWEFTQAIPLVSTSLLSTQALATAENKLTTISMGYYQLLCGLYPIGYQILVLAGALLLNLLLFQLELAMSEQLQLPASKKVVRTTRVSHTVQSSSFKSRALAKVLNWATYRVTVGAFSRLSNHSKHLKLYKEIGSRMVSNIQTHFQQMKGIAFKLWRKRIKQPTSQISVQKLLKMVSLITEKLNQSAGQFFTVCEQMQREREERRVQAREIKRERRKTSCRSQVLNLARTITHIYNSFMARSLYNIRNVVREGWLWDEALLGLSLNYFQTLLSRTMMEAGWNELLIANEEAKILEQEARRQVLYNGFRVLKDSAKQIQCRLLKDGLRRINQVSDVVSRISRAANCLNWMLTKKIQGEAINQIHSAVKQTQQPEQQFSFQIKPQRISPVASSIKHTRIALPASHKAQMSQYMQRPSPPSSSPTRIYSALRQYTPSPPRVTFPFALPPFPGQRPGSPSKLMPGGWSPLRHQKQRNYFRYQSPAGLMSIQRRHRSLTPTNKVQLPFSSFKQIEKYLSALPNSVNQLNHTFGKRPVQIVPARVSPQFVRRSLSTKVARSRTVHQLKFSFEVKQTESRVREEEPIPQHFQPKSQPKQQLDEYPRRLQPRQEEQRQLGKYRYTAPRRDPQNPNFPLRMKYTDIRVPPSRISYTGKAFRKYPFIH